MTRTAASRTCSPASVLTRPGRRAKSLRSGQHALEDHGLVTVSLVMHIASPTCNVRPLIGAIVSGSLSRAAASSASTASPGSPGSRATSRRSAHPTSLRTPSAQAVASAQVHLGVGAERIAPTPSAIARLACQPAPGLLLAHDQHPLEQPAAQAADETLTSGGDLPYCPPATQ